MSNRPLKNTRIAIVLSVLALLAMTSCSPSVSETIAPSSTPVPPTQEPVQASAPLTEAVLNNGAYQIEEIGTIQLTDGGYENRYGEGETMVDRAGLLSTALGKLNDDDLEDAAVVLWYNSGGSGSFIYLIALVNDNGAPKQIASKLLGDRVQIESLTIQSQQIALQAIVHGPDDPLCCPSQHVTWVYTIQDGRLSQIMEFFADTPTPENTPAPEVTPTIELTPAPEPTTVVEKAVGPLDGTQWALVTYRDQAGDLAAILEGATVTAAFQDGQITGKAACNSYFGSYEAGDGKITFGELGQTEMYCMDPEGIMDLESAYLQDLGLAAGFEIKDGVLTLTGSDNSPVATFGPPIEQNPLIGTWQWIESTTPVGSITVDNPARYVLEFKPGGEFLVTADCNSGSGTYTLNENQLTLEVGPMTLVACPEGSLGDRFVQDLNSAAYYFIEDGDLYIDMMMDSGTLRFGK